MASWSLPMGGNLTADGAAFRVWAPNARAVEVVIEAGDTGGESRTFPLTAGSDGVHAGMVPGLRAGDCYRYRLDGGGPFPDPYSRFQPDGPHGPSMLVDPAAFTWTDAAWPGLTRDGLVIYELHVGAMTPAGTYDALREQLPELRRLGVTALELMPLADAPGRWNWGYDGVNWYAPNHTYGSPDALRRLVDAAHRLGLGILLDVVYNHFGPDGNYLRAFSEEYFTARHQTPWGDGINYDGEHARAVRDLAINNACYWLTEFHVDGFRFDAIDTIVDDSPRHVLAELTSRARAVAGRPIVLIAEQAVNDVRIIQPVASGGLGMDAAWADDFHHVVRVAVTGEREGYYGDYAGTLAELRTVLREGFLYQGQPGLASGERRGTRVTAEPAAAFVFCIENHDQVGNRAFGERLSHLVPRDLYAALSTLLLFAPETPLLFMGQEFAASSPFQFFTDHHAELGELVTAGRREEFKGFSAFADPARRAEIPNPQDPATFERSKLRLADRAEHAGIYALYQELLRLRREDPVLRDQSRERIDIIVIAERAVAVQRWTGGELRVLLLNLGEAPVTLAADSAAFANADTGSHALLLSTTDGRFGGDGTMVTRGRGGQETSYEIPPRSAIVIATRRAAGGS